MRLIYAVTAVFAVLLVFLIIFFSYWVLIQSIEGPKTKNDKRLDTPHGPLRITDYNFNNIHYQIISEPYYHNMLILNVTRDSLELLKSK